MPKNQPLAVGDLFCFPEICRGQREFHFFRVDSTHDDGIPLCTWFCPLCEGGGFSLHHGIPGRRLMNGAADHYRCSVEDFNYGLRKLKRNAAKITLIPIRQE